MSPKTGTSTGSSSCGATERTPSTSSPRTPPGTRPGRWGTPTSMPSDRASDRLEAVVVGDPAASRRWVTGAEAGSVRFLSPAEAAAWRPWPIRPLVLLGPATPSRKEVEALRRRARLGRNPGWYLLAPPGREREVAAWRPVTDRFLPAPVPAAVLAALGESRRQAAQSARETRTERRRAAALARRLDLLSDTIRAAGSLLDPQMVSRFIMDRAARLVRARHWRLYRLDERHGLLRLDEISDATGGDPAEPPAAWLPLDCGIAGVTARSRETFYVADPATDPRVDRELEWPGEPPSALLSAPLISRGRVIGVALVAEPRGGRFRPGDIELIRTLLEPAAIALDNAQLFRKLEERTVTDDLTGLYNARFMENYLRRETKRAVRYGHPVSLLFIDLDGFKQVNDVHGHMAGSRTLEEVGDILKRDTRDIDVAARWGGDEFTVVLPDTGAEGAMKMAERLRERISSHRYLASLGLDVRISASIGVAAFPEHGTTAEQLLAAADAAMYRVKGAGKNGVAFAEPVQLPQPAG
ncbi:MAG: sensor domain-containing diguanylate cyclase [Acidobacteria bacterium]|nr:MAG: sensor domain-containing diguanylate cyclase [Acidobacteriota bacterium]